MGYYLKSELQSAGHIVFGIDINGGDMIADLLDKESLMHALEEFSPDVVFHLAGISSVAASWKYPQKTIDINVKGTINLLECIRERNRKTRLVLIGSSDQYGSVLPDDCPISEDHLQKSANPYAISKFAQEQMGMLYSKAYNMDILFTRSFNHTGAGQGKGFVIPDFASQIAEMELGGQHVIRVGNLSAQRDFSDVRDIVRAYRLIAERGKSGEVYNVGAGRAYIIRNLLDMLVRMARTRIIVQVDPMKIRPVDLPVMYGNINKLVVDTGYRPRYGIGDTLADTLEYWRTKIRSNG